MAAVGIIRSTSSPLLSLHEEVWSRGIQSGGMWCLQEPTHHYKARHADADDAPHPLPAACMLVGLVVRSCLQADGEGMLKTCCSLLAGHAVCYTSHSL
jgi:hypothetical protein